MANRVGTLYKISEVHFYEQKCTKEDPHAQHVLAAGGGGGGSGGGTYGLIRGDQKIETGYSTETWCPGVKQA